MNMASRKNIGESVILKTILLVMLIAGIMIAGKPIGEKNTQVLNKVAANDQYHSFLINNLFNYYSNNGDGSYNTFHAASALEYPKGSGNTAVYEDGFLIGGITRTSVTDATKIVKVGGSAYRHGWQAGRITQPGTATTAATTDVATLSARIFKVRPDVRPGIPLDAELTQKLQSEELDLTGRSESGASIQKIYDSYILDWNEWPASQGAPFADKNGNGIYEPTIDSAGVPGADQTLWHVSNDLDASRTKFLYGSDPIGLELQRTIWGYKRGGALGNTIFLQYKLINKSGAAIESTYVAQWSDPDLGGAGDDFCGSDTVLSLGYVYNGKSNDEQYGTKPPASGYDFFQGPTVPSVGDSAKVGGKYRQGFKNLPMTSFNFFVNGNATYTDPAQGVIGGTVSWYRLMKGLIGTTGAPYVNPITGKVTTYVLTGDPVTSSGWLDGEIAPPGDRRLSMSSGPFTMADGDTQEIVVATLVGQGGDRLSSVSVLKFYDKAAQAAYDANFDLAPPPASPKVAVTNSDGAIVLNWGDVVAAAITESNNAKGYKFQGYNVYQNKTSSYSPDNAKLLATFDVNDGVGVIRDEIYDASVGTTVIKPVQFGTDGGLSRTFTITTDAFTSQPLVNGRSYYFFVTAYNYNPDPLAIPNNLESAPTLIEVIPQSAAPGVRFGQQLGDTLKLTHPVGVSEGNVYAIVVDPTKLTGHNYSITFDTTGGNIFWKLTDVTTGTLLLDKQYNTAGDADYYTVDGLLVKVTGVATPGMKPGVQGSAISDSPDIGFEIVTGVRAFTWAGGGSPFLANGMEGFGGGMGGGFQFSNILSGIDPVIPGSDIGDVLVELAGTTATGSPIDAASDTVSMAYRYVRNGQLAAADASFAPFLPPNTPAPVGGSYGFIDRRPSPIRVYEWNTATQTKGQRLNFGFLENNIAKAAPTGGRVDGLYWPPTNGEVASYVAATNPREWLFIFRSTYNATTNDPALTVNLLATGTPMLYWWTVARNGQPWAGNSYKIVSYKPNQVADVFNFTAPAATSTVADAKADVDKINVFPNPYFGLNARETSKYSRFVTFNHLPQKATIRIFNLAGILLRTINKDDASQFARWDLRNEASLPAGAGMYIVHIDMPEIGTKKILKLAIIPEVQFLDKF